MGTQSSKLPPLKAMEKKVDPNNLFGKWYVIGCIPTIFEKDAHNASEDYQWVDDKR